MELMYIIWISTFLFCDAFSTRLKDRQVFHLQPFDAANKTDGAYRSGVAPSAKQRVKTRSRRISDKRVAAEISLEGGEAKEPSATDDLVFDAGEDERLLEYEDDYRVLKKEYATVERTQMISNERDFDEDSACWWIFCYLSSKSAFILIVVVLLTLFWCYSGLICYYLPCGWVSREKLRTEIRYLLEASRPGQVVDARGNVLHYQPCDEELEKFRELLEEFQDL